MIAVDAMGGDYAPEMVLKGALRAARQGIPIIVFGYPEIINRLTQLDAQWQHLPIKFEPCTQQIEMSEEPSKAIIRKKDASLVRAAQAVKEGRATALVSAGNSGAVLAVGTLIIGRVAHVLRPAFGNFIPTLHGSVFCLDLGANTDCKAEYLEQFAYMGAAYVHVVHKIVSPRIALLSNGHEPYKGSLAVKEAYGRLEKVHDINFVGNVEARDIFTASIDVLVMDGFVGNILLKSMQGTIRALFNWIKQEAQKSFLRRIMALCAKPLLKAIAATTDYQHVGGAMLLGVKKPVIIAHGCSQQEALYNAILLAYTSVKNGDFEQINARIEQTLSSLRVMQKDALGMLQQVQQ